MDFNKPVSPETVARTAEALHKNGITVINSTSKADAKAQVLKLIPPGSQVMTMTSVSLEETGLDEAVNSGSDFVSVKNQLYSMDRKTQSQLMQQTGAAPEYTLGSVHAVTETGQVVVASNSGSQLPAYAYGSPNVIWVVGTQKIVPDLETAMARINDYILPLESERARKAYGVPGSFVSKLLIFNREPNPSRLTLVFVPEVLGY